MNQNHYDVFYSSNKDSLVGMLMRAMEEITKLNQENGELNKSVCDHITAGAEMRNEINEAETANIYLHGRTKELVLQNDTDRADLRREYRQRTELLVAFVVKRPKPYIFSELFGPATWLLVDDAVCNGKKILAIKHLRKHSGLTLHDAKQCIDALIESRKPARSSAPTGKGE